MLEAVVSVEQSSVLLVHVQFKKIVSKYIIVRKGNNVQDFPIVQVYIIQA